MEGFRRLEWLDYYITEKSPGFFLLSNDGETILESGWSSDDVGAELKKVAQGPRGVEGKFAYFWVQCESNSYQAFATFCKLWHRYNKSPNGHPKPPEGKDWECPVEGCEWREGLCHRF